MRLYFTKKKVFLFFALIVFLITFISSLVFIILNNRKNVLPEYAELMEYCEKEIDEDAKRIKCTIFIQKEVLKEGNILCFDLLVYDGFGNLIPHKLCEDKDLFDWENPYPDYSLYVPVVMSLRYRDFLWGGNKIKKIKFEPMEDSKAFEILDVVNVSNTKHIFIWSQEVLDMKRRPYEIITIGEEEGEDFNPTGNLLVIEDAVLELFNIEGDELTMLFFISLDQKETTLLLKSAREDIVERDLHLGSKYALYLEIEDEKFFTEDLVQEEILAISGEGENKFLLYSLIEIEEQNE